MKASEADVIARRLEIHGWIAAWPTVKHHMPWMPLDHPPRTRKPKAWFHAKNTLGTPRVTRWRGEWRVRVLREIPADPVTGRPPAGRIKQYWLYVSMTPGQMMVWLDAVEESMDQACDRIEDFGRVLKTHAFSTSLSPQ